MFKNAIEDKIIKDIIEVLKKRQHLNDFQLSIICKEDKDFINSLIQKISKCNSINKGKTTRKDILEILSKEIIISKNHIYIYQFALIKDSAIELLSDAIINTGNLEYIYKFATDVEDVPIDKFLNIIINSDNPEIITDFIYNIAYCGGTTTKDIFDVTNQLIDKLIDNKEYEWINTLVDYELPCVDNVKMVKFLLANEKIKDIMRAINVAGMYPEDFVDYLIRSKDLKKIFYFAKRFPNVKTAEILNAIIESESQYIYRYAREIENAPIKQLAEAIIKTNDPDHIYRFALYVKGAPIKYLAEAIISTGDIKSITDFANIPNAPIEKLAKIVVINGNSRDILNFARNVKDAPVDYLAEAIIKFGNIEEIYLFAKYVKNAPVNKLFKAIKEK